MWVVVESTGLPNILSSIHLTPGNTFQINSSAFQQCRAHYRIWQYVADWHCIAWEHLELFGWNYRSSCATEFSWSKICPFHIWHHWYINDGSLDGKNRFHATHIACWQTGPAADMGLTNLQPSKTSTLTVRVVMNELFSAGTNIWTIWDRKHPIGLVY